MNFWISLVIREMSLEHIFQEKTLFWDFSLFQTRVFGNVKLNGGKDYFVRKSIKIEKTKILSKTKILEKIKKHKFHRLKHKIIIASPIIHSKTMNIQMTHTVWLIQWVIVSVSQAMIHTYLFYKIRHGPSVISVLTGGK